MSLSWVLSKCCSKQNMGFKRLYGTECVDLINSIKLGQVPGVLPAMVNSCGVCKKFVIDDQKHLFNNINGVMLPINSQLLSLAITNHDSNLPWDTKWIVLHDTDFSSEYDERLLMYLKGDVAATDHVCGQLCCCEEMDLTEV